MTKAVIYAAAVALCLAAGHAGAAGKTGSGAVTGGGMSIFDTPSETACRACHDDTARYPMLGSPNPTKHHELLGKPVVLPTAPQGVTPAGTYACTTCHTLDITSTGTTLSPFRDCFSCHAVSTVTGTQTAGTNRHHYLGYECTLCHVLGGGR